MIDSILPSSLVVAKTTPASYPNLTVWFRANEDLANISDGTAISGSTMWISHWSSSFSASQTYSSSGYPELRKNALGSGLHGVYFVGSRPSSLYMTEFNRTDAGAQCTAVIVLKPASTAATDQMLMSHPSVNMQLRIYVAGNNRTSWTCGDGTDQSANTFVNTVYDATKVLWFAKTGSGAGGWFYEQDDDMGIGGGAHSNVTNFGRFSLIGKFGPANILPFTGSIAEIIIWERPFSPSEITKLWNEYFKPRYANATSLRQV